MRSGGRSGVLPHPGGPEGSKPTPGSAQPPGCPFPQTRESHAQPDVGGRARMARADGGVTLAEPSRAVDVACTSCRSRSCGSIEVVMFVSRRNTKDESAEQQTSACARKEWPGMCQPMLLREWN
ncbi:hypothetical protein HPB47_003806 [Ixodes persulcatus]|uniref:Uncharacterized protein n=1 Tax=Ixodes persulcatus TaxID=34615 RepID=A0AC60PHK1_IXOPE|nr:hypothetical protein HPB47_003806 [Ixodes persulcatus]